MLPDLASAGAARGEGLDLAEPTCTWREAVSGLRGLRPPRTFATAAAGAFTAAAAGVTTWFALLLNVRTKGLLTAAATERSEAEARDRSRDDARGSGGGNDSYETSDVASLLAPKSGFRAAGWRSVRDDDRAEKKIN